MNRRAFLGVGCSSLGYALVGQFGLTGLAQAAASKTALGSFGLDLAGRDLSIRPGDDFWKHGGGTWMANNPIPSDRPSWGAFDALAAKAEEDVRALVDEVAAKTGAPGSLEQKIGDFYRSYMDIEAINAKGLAPIQPELDRIAAAKTHQDVAAIMAAPDIPSNGPISWGVTLDDGNPDRYLVAIGHSGISLPDKEYYLGDDARFAELRAKFPTHVSRLLTLAGQSDGDAKGKKILALETEIAKLHWDIAERRDSTKMYNLRKRAQLDELAPDFPWSTVFQQAGYGDIQECIVQEISAIGPLAKLFVATPVETWQAYLTYHAVNSSAGILPQPLYDERFDFYGRTLNGQPEPRPRWKRAIQALDDALGEAVGQLYVARHFTPTAKAKMVDLVENLRKAFAVRIDGLTWMTKETKLKAKAKLATFRPKIGYPDQWRDYSGLEVKMGDAIGNERRAMAFGAARDAADLARKTDRGRWFMTPQTVNAYYNPVFNEIVFPAAILQAPFFDENADPAVNYGGIGGVIGHEMGHGFDDQGAKYDEKGVLRDWWTQADVTAFNALGAKMVAQYGGFEALPGVKLNGELTLGENIGDHCGVVVGLTAYHLSLKGKPAPVLDGLSGDQRFFLSWSQIWRDVSRDEALRNQVQSDPHSPAQFRVNGTVQNVDAWYQAFNVQPGHKLYVAPDKRVRIW
ncbi:neutral endopeptidase [Candidatus Phycosocius bacilliformis]|uniref:Neutral endopeptidase n=1 Tax=Candidatus Phycosocius bacilliformis TaxID=1445552 RepID=A0A2P2EC07_9PROT|nr:M13-type metalloendopeptidase [Candidatus Phycosocius bacilliformis]GBF58583.1 neutral endopeptidase [Candidatus Phycosocius bacilliformis]